MATIELDDVTVTAPTADGDTVLLRDVTARLTERRIVVVGANGSGKSTLVRLLNGLVTASSGTVRVDGLDVATDGPAVRRRVGFVFTQPSAQLVMPTVIEDVALSLRRHVPDKREREERARAVLAEIGLAERAHTSVHALSGGQQQLLALAGVLACEPSVVVADEPTTLLDLRNARAVEERLLSMAPQLVLVTHDLALARRCERALVVEDGRVTLDADPEAAVAHYVESTLS